MNKNITNSLELKVANFLSENKISFLHENENKSQKLDFYLPDFDVYIEVKKFFSQRSENQLAEHDNIILLQGKKAVDFFVK